MASLNVSDVMQDITLTITVPRTMRFRVWLGGHIVRLGCAVIGIKSNVETQGDK